MDGVVWSQHELTLIAHHLEAIFGWRALVVDAFGLGEVRVGGVVNVTTIAMKVGSCHLVRVRGLGYCAESCNNI